MCQIYKSVEPIGCERAHKGKVLQEGERENQGGYDLHTVPTAELNLTSFVKEAQRKFGPKLYIRSRVLSRISTLLDMYVSNLRNRTHECGGVHQRAGSASPPPPFQKPNICTQQSSCSLITLILRILACTNYVHKKPSLVVLSSCIQE